MLNLCKTERNCEGRTLTISCKAHEDQCFLHRHLCEMLSNKRECLLSSEMHLKWYLWEIWLIPFMPVYFRCGVSAYVTDQQVTYFWCIKHILSWVLVLPYVTSGHHCCILSCWLLKMWFSMWELEFHPSWKLGFLSWKQNSQLKTPNSLSISQFIPFLVIKIFLWIKNVLANIIAENVYSIYQKLTFSYSLFVYTYFCMYWYRK